MPKIKCTKCHEEKSISSKGLAKREKSDSHFQKKYVCRTCKGELNRAEKKKKK